MNFNFNNFSPRQMGIGLILFLLFFFFMLDAVPGLLFILFGIGALWMFREFSSGTLQDRNFTDRERPATVQRPANTERVHAHALEAVTRAGLDPDTLTVLPVDIGLLSFHGDEEPMIHRTQRVYDDADYVQPFVQLRVPVAARGRIKFEIFDAAGQKVYAHEDHYDLKRGRNLIIPSTRLPIHDERSTDGRWKMRVSADGMLLATHYFEWQESEQGVIRRHIAEDGEISSEMRALLVENRLESMSLDELLAPQDDEEQRQQRR